MVVNKRFGDGLVLVAYDCIESVEGVEALGEKFTLIVMKSGRTHEVRQSVSEIIETYGLIGL